MKVGVRVFGSKLGKSTKEALVEALEMEDLVLTGELKVDPFMRSEEAYWELTFEEEVVKAEVDTPEDKEKPE